jgi:hypothetical protein
MTDDILQRLERELDEAELKAFDSLSRYKFQMFGYWAAIWVHLNRISGQGRPSPFRHLVAEARASGIIPRRTSRGSRSKDAHS